MRNLSYRDALDPLAQSIHEYMIASPALRAVRFRRDLLAKTIDDVASEAENANVLSVACGHLREIALSKAARSGRLGRFVALDQDSQSLDVVRKDYGILGVEVECAAVKKLITGHLRYENMHLIYGAGLYDYLPQAAAQKLTANLFAMLAPGGASSDRKLYALHS